MASWASSGPGYLADLLLVDGDPLADVSILQNRDRLLAIMKDGVFYKGGRSMTGDPFAGRQVPRLTAWRGPL